MMHKYKGYIGEDATQIRELGMKEDGFDVYLVAEKMGVEIIKNYDIDKLAYSGAVTQKDDGTVTIWIHPDDHETRQTFTIAHEIGHLLKGHLKNVDLGEIRDDAISMFRSGKQDEKEWEANEFAADMLMPVADIEKELGELLAENKNIAVSEGVAILAKKFEVSQAAMRVRLNFLGKIKKK